jgi:SAM-dependent methyltransferase
MEPCLVCGGASFDTPVLGSLARCRTCGFIFFPRTPDLPQRIEALYAGEYLTGAEFGDYASQRDTFARNFQGYLRRMRDAGATGGRLVEVGCAYGFFLEQARASFDVTGLDVNEAAIASAQAMGVRAIFGDFRTWAPDAPFDVVCMWDTIEHLLEPRQYLDHARDVLTDGGLLFLTTGDIGSPLARLRGAHWRMIHPPSHLNYFSRDTMTRLLDRAGFDLVSVRSVGTYRDLANSMHVLSLFSKRPMIRRAAGSVERALGGRSMGFYLNLHDIMFVAARKRGRGGRGGDGGHGERTGG